MLYLLAAVGAVTTGLLLWKAFGPDAGPDVRPSTAPDDDPDFLRGLGGRGPDEER